MRRHIASLFDYSGEWCKPYREAGYKVTQVDLKLGHDILKLDPGDLGPVHGVLAAPPCTHFAVSGAQYWKAKDDDGRTDEMLALVDHTLALIAAWKPAWWALENPVGRLAKLRPQLGKPKLIWQPHWYGDPWTKRTCLWGDFNPDLPRSDVDPVRWTKQGSWTQRYGGSSERTKEARSMTPPGFARAFFSAND